MQSALFTDTTETQHGYNRHFSNLDGAEGGALFFELQCSN